MQAWQMWEEQFLAPWAAKSSRSKGRALAEEECPLRTLWQRDRDRIIHSKAFRRLMHKTQVFINPKGDHFRTRMTHTLEVSQISRTVSRSLCLNEDLTEAIALGHDLGHTPFGHAGERALNQLCPPFAHTTQGVRLVTLLERDGQGLNLTAEVIDGILGHSGPHVPETLEGQVVRLCDRVAYLNHDIDDAIRSGYLAADQIPRHIQQYLGDRPSQRIDTMVRDIVRSSQGRPVVEMSETCSEIMHQLREFMFDRVYRHPVKLAEEDRLEKLLFETFDYCMAHPDALPEEYQREPHDQAVCDYMAGMTDTFALEYYETVVAPGRSPKAPSDKEETA